MKPETKKNSNERYYTYISVYVDDICMYHENPQAHMDNIGAAFDLKTGSVTFPDMYLGTNVKRRIFCDGSK